MKTTTTEPATPAPDDVVQVLPLVALRYAGVDGTAAPRGVGPGFGPIQLRRAFALEWVALGLVAPDGWTLTPAESDAKARTAFFAFERQRHAAQASPEEWLAVPKRRRALEAIARMLPDGGAELLKELQS